MCLRNLFDYSGRHPKYEFRVLRNKRSYEYKDNPNAPSGFDNNWRNNSIDVIRLMKGDDCLFTASCQSVANYNWGEYKSNGATEWGDTIVGSFGVKLFVPPRNFHGRIHGIVNAKDTDGQDIDESSMQVVDGYQTGRWLIHDRFSFKTNCDTNYAWSAGCIILSSSDLERLNEVLDSEGLCEGDIIEGHVVEG